MSNRSTPLSALKRAIAKAGSQSELARICGVSQTAVWKWLHVIGAMPPQFVLKAEAATGVSRHSLRPDIYPVEQQPIRDAVSA